MQALYPAAVVSVQIAEVPDLVSFRFAHVTIFVRKVFFVAEAARPMLDRLEFDFPSVHAVEQTEQTVFGLVFSGFGEQIHRTRLRVLQGITNDLINKSLVIFISFFWAKFGHFLVLSIKILFC